MSKEVDDLTAAMSDLAAAVNAAAAQLKGDQHDPAAIEGFAGQAKSLAAVLTGAMPAPAVALATDPAAPVADPAAAPAA